MVISVIAFSVWHLPESFVSALDHMAFGALMCILFLNSSTLILPILFHIMNNAISLLFTYTPNAAMELLGAEVGIIIAKYTLWIGILLWILPARFRANQLTKWATGSVRREVDRIAALDLLRGVALFLIVTENALLFIKPSANSTLDRLVRSAYAFLFEYRGIGLFSILLGFSLFALMHGRGQDVRLRNVAFIAIGTVHGIFIFSSDVLALYGLVLTLVVWRIRRSGGLSILWLLLVFVCWLGGSVLTGFLNRFSDLQIASLAAPTWAAGFESRAMEWGSIIVSAPIAGLQILLPLTVGYLSADALATKTIWSARLASLRLAIVLCAASIALCGPRGIEIWLGAAPKDVSWFSESVAAGGGMAGALGLWVLGLNRVQAWKARRAAHFGLAVRAIIGAGRNTLTGYFLSSVVMIVAFSTFGLDLARHGIAVLLTVACLFWGVFCVATVLASRPLWPLEEAMRRYCDTSPRLVKLNYPTSAR